MLLIAYKDIGLAVNTGKTKYMNVERHRGMVTSRHVTAGSNSYEKVLAGWMYGDWFSSLGELVYLTSWYESQTWVDECYKYIQIIVILGVTNCKSRCLNYLQSANSGVTSVWLWLGTAINELRTKLLFLLILFITTLPLYHLTQSWRLSFVWTT